MMLLSILIALAVAASFGFTFALRTYAVRKGLIDTPNSRSSHTRPTPRGGGLAIATVVLVAIAVGAVLLELDRALAAALLLGGFFVAFVGFLDDRGDVALAVRFLIHVAASVVAVYCLGGLPDLEFAGYRLHLGAFGDFLAVLAIVWTLNLFNFMDGIDGLAASEAIFVNVGGGMLILISGGNFGIATLSFTVAAASLGFLLWNWPPAKIFMGDVGSGFLGFVIAVVAIGSGRDNGVMPLVWLVLGGVFFVDATLTLARRLLRGERAHVAHRTHAYQWLSRRWQSHLAVTVLLWAINVLWLLPMAWLCVKQPSHAVLLTAVALLPLAILAIWAGAGKPERAVAGSGVK